LVFELAKSGIDEHLAFKSFGRFFVGKTHEQ
jgi:hypothetical protein